jgi:hypothetical protein
MNKEFVPYEQALDLKELGFDEPCILLYRGLDTQPVCQMDYEFKIEKNSDFNDETNYWLTVPLYQQAFRWFREKYDLFGCIDLHTSTPIHWYIRIDDIIKNDYVYHSEDENLKYNTYEEAELGCLKQLIEIVKNK